MGKAKLETFRNPTHFLIIIHLLKKPNNAYGLSLIDTFNKSQSVAYRELIELEKDNYIIPKDTGKNVYEVNYIKLFEIFYDLFLEYIEEMFKIYSFDLNNNGDLIKISSKLIQNKYNIDNKIELIKYEKFRKNLENNSYFKIFLVEYLIFLIKSSELVKTIEHAFQRLLTRDLMYFNGEIDTDFFERMIGMNREILRGPKEGRVELYTKPENKIKIEYYKNNLEFLEYVEIFNFISNINLKGDLNYVENIFDKFLEKDNILKYIKNK
ncbi:MAG: hypothetical protein PHT94_04990 [Candidatus Nanoarchaeia archaeon]|nr:hypothetical protein [Candidatus Nanoarchaeia archaeon]